VSELQDCFSSVFVSCCYEKLVAEAADSLGNQGKGNVLHWKPLPGNGTEDVHVDLSYISASHCTVSVTSICTVYRLEMQLSFCLSLFLSLSLSRYMFRQ
jgi:hypothetical protein